MPLAVARQEHDGQAGDLAHQQRPGRLAPRAFDGLGLSLLEPGQIVNARAADDSENGFCHDFPYCLDVSWRGASLETPGRPVFFRIRPAFRSDRS